LIKRIIKAPKKVSNKRNNDLFIFPPLFCEQNKIIATISALG